MAEGFEHVPVLAGEVLAHLVFPPNRVLRLIDGTVGGGGHSALLLEKYPNLELLGIDRDDAALAKAQERLSFARERVRLVRGNYSELAVKAFTTDPTLVEMGARGMRIVVMFYPVIGFQMVTSNFFQSIGMAKKAIILSLSRQVMILIPCLIVLPLFWGADGVWFSMPISDAAASVIAAVMLYRQFKQFKKRSAV